MTNSSPLDTVIRTDTPEEMAGHLTYTVNALIRTARLALENDSSGLCNDAEKISAVAETLEVAQAIMAVVIDGTESLERECRRGMWKKDEAA